MCTTWCQQFARNLPPDAISGARVLEIGSLDVNGSCRQQIIESGAWSYLGTDMRWGKGVDLVCEASQLPVVVGSGCYDLLICTEALEHMEHWQTCLVAMMDCLKVGGLLCLTTRSEGFPWHEYPDDFWRFSLADMLRIFETQHVCCVAEDYEQPGVGVIVRKTEASFSPGHIEVHRMHRPS